jgi:hypothetical protein
MAGMLPKKAAQEKNLPLTRVHHLRAPDPAQERSMNVKCLLVIVLGAFALAATPAYPQTGGPFPPIGDDVTTSLGSFRIRIADRFASLFNGCPGYNSTTKILQSPTLFDPATVIGRSNVTIDDSPFRLGSVPAGSARVVIPEDTLIPPPGFGFGPGTREVHTEVHALKMTAGPVMVRAGIWYNDPANPSMPVRVSPGEVESKSGPSFDPSRDFPASSFFDVYVHVDLPPCGSFPGGTLYNLIPLTVKNDNVDHFPPRVVYLHDASSIVPILFVFPNGTLWLRDDILGYFLLAGHGVGFGNSPADQQEFNNFMNGQSNIQCPISCGPVASNPAPSPVFNASKPLIPAETAKPAANASNKPVSSAAKR